MTALLDYLTLEDPDGIQVDLENGATRLISRLEGLQGLRVRSSTRPRPGGQGSINRTRYRDDRPITASSTFHGSTPVAAWSEYHDVSRALAGAVDTDRLLRAGVGDLDLQCLVRCVEMQAPIEVTDRKVATQYTLLASDPRMYAQTPVTVDTGAALVGGGGITEPITEPFTSDVIGVVQLDVTNAGTVPVPATFTLDGYLLDPLIRLDTGEQLQLTGTIANGASAVIDSDARSILLNGADAIYLLDFTRSGWFEIPVGTSTVQLLAADTDANAALSVSLRPAYE